MKFLKYDKETMRFPSILGTGLQRYDSYDDDAAGPTNRITVFTYEVLPEIKEHITGKHIVDVGCGNGRIAAEFSSICSTVTAIDPFREMNQRNERKNIRFLNTTLQDFEPDCEIDALYLHGVLYLMGNWDLQEAFNKMVQLIPSGGVIIIVGDRKRNISLNPPWEPGYYNLDFLCNQSGCEVISNKLLDSGVLRTVVIRKL
tara:strand:+ start:82 stop:684 length:603 start_codon:yes stop_codon:yes gene_type:complete